MFSLIVTARLPIGEYLEMSSRKVLAVNHGKTGYEWTDKESCRDSSEVQGDKRLER